MRTSDDLLADLKKLHPKLIDLSLGRIERLLQRMGSPHTKLPPTVIIAGTNGKGSTTAFLKAMLEAAGQRVHVYSSPHLVRFAERIAIAGPDGRARPISEDALVDVLERVAKINAGEEITFFEITTAAAFQAFHETPADVVLLEVGLGGRLDTTNVVPHPALSVITPVSMDHADKLGATVSLIAREKAGILRAGGPAVISQQSDEAMDAIRAEADRLRADLTVWGQDFEAFEQRTRAGTAASVNAQHRGEPGWKQVVPQPLTPDELNAIYSGSRQFFYRDGQLLPTWQANDFGVWAWNLMASSAKGWQRTDMYVHTTPQNEATTAANQTVLLTQSHGCVHIRPRDRDQMMLLGYLQKGVRFVVKKYGVQGPVPGAGAAPLVA